MTYGVKTFLAITTAAFVACCGASTAYAQEGYSTDICGPYESMVSILSDNHGEGLQFQALNFEGRLISFFANEDSGTWTVLVTDTDMRACMYDAGIAYTNMRDLGNAY